MQIPLLSANTLSAVVSSQCYYSVKAGSDVMVFPDGLSPICLPAPDYLMAMKEKLFIKYLESFRRIALSSEEFLLLRAMILLHSGTTIIFMPLWI